MMTYLQEIKNLSEQLRAIGNPLSETMKIFSALRGLGRDYEPIKTTIENAVDSTVCPSFEDIIPKLTSFDDRLQSYSTGGDASSHLAFSATQQAAMYTSRGRSSRGRGSRGRGRGSFSTRGRGFHQQFSSPHSDSEQKMVCQICGKSGHPAIRCWHRFDNSYQDDEVPNALAALRITEVTDGSEWYPDSGATAHVTNSTQRLNHSQPYYGSDSVMVGDGNYLPITHVGSAELASTSGKLPLRDVLVCPDIAKSLLSVSKLTSDYPCSFKFDCDGVRIKDKATKRLLMVGANAKGLYKLTEPRIQTFYSTRQHSTTDEVWHRRLGHPNPQVLQLLESNKAIVVNKRLHKVCTSCHLGKSSRLPFVSSSFVASKPLERVHCDLWGPAPVASVQGFHYYVIFIDNFSRFSWLYPLKNKSDFLSTFVKFKAMIEKLLSTTILTFQCDGGGEFMSTEFKSILTTAGIQQLVSCPHTPQQNGLAERKHRHVTELGLAMMFQSHIPQKHWVEAFVTANFLINLLPSTVNTSTKSPFEVLHKKRPEYSSLRTFGCACYPTLRDYSASKFDPKSLLCVFLGYMDNYKGYRCYYPPTGRVYISRHVIFDENSFPFSGKYFHLKQAGGSPLLQAWQKSFVPPPQQREPPRSDPVVTSHQVQQASLPLFTAADFPPLPSQIQQPESSPASTVSSHECPERTAGYPDAIGDSAHASNRQDATEPVQTEQHVQEGCHPMITRAKAGIRKPNPRYVLLTQKVAHPEPATVAEALKHPGWTAAMTEEIDNCKETKTFSLVPRTSDMNLIGNRWVHRVKLNADGTVQCLRSRLVAKGYTQEEGIDYLETYSPVVRTATVRLVFHLATILKWDIRQLDVKNSFLHGDLAETVYMEQPAGFIDKAHPDHVWKLHKALYGLKQSPRAWFDKFSTFLLEFGFTCSKKDPSLFIYRRDKNVIMLLLYVDDIAITGNSTALLNQLIAEMSKQFRMKDMGPLHYFLGIQAQFLAEGLFLSQQKYAEDLLAVAGMSDCAPMPTPLPLQLNKQHGQDTLFSNPSYFRKLAGKLQYLTLTRPDLQFSVNFVFSRVSDCTLRAYSDSDWAGCKDTRRSTGGLCTFLGQNLISWSSKKQPTVSKSSTEAEYRSLSETASEMAWMCQILRELGVPLHLTPQLFCDNLSAVMLTANPGYLQLADIFTKSLPEAPFTALRRKLGVDVPSTPSLRGAVKPNDTAPLNEHTLGLSKSKPTTNTCQTQTLQRSPAVELHDKGRATMKELCTKSKSSPVPIHNRYSSLQLSD